MKCREVARIINHSQTAHESIGNPILIHARSCPACYDLLLLNELVSVIVKAGCASGDEIERTATNPFLMSKIRNRIQELREQRFGSWETAVAAMRGWLVAFATVAIILIAVSVQRQPSTITSDLDDEPGAQTPAEYLISDMPNSVNPYLPSEDDPYAHK